jgi:hypothetical protein
VWERALLLAGVALQLWGVVLTIVGARTVWRDIKGPDDRFLAPFIRAWVPVQRWIRRRWRRITGRGESLIVTAGVAAASGSAGRLSVSKSWGPLPSGASTDELIAELHRRVKASQDDLYRERDQLRTELIARIDAAVAEHQELGREIRERDEQERRRAVQGLRLEAYGFILLTLGTLVQAVGSYFGID